MSPLFHVLGHLLPLHNINAASPYVLPTLSAVALIFLRCDPRSGPIPEALGALDKLELLALFNNQLNGRRCSLPIRSAVFIIDTLSPRGLLATPLARANETQVIWVFIFILIFWLWGRNMMNLVLIPARVDRGPPHNVYS